MALLIGALLPATAASSKKTISVTTGVPIYVDGVEMKPTDANGNPVETFLYNDTTYVPLRAVSQYLGKAVKWDGNTRSVYIGDVPGKKHRFGMYVHPTKPEEAMTMVFLKMFLLLDTHTVRAMLLEVMDLYGLI